MRHDYPPDIAPARGCDLVALRIGYEEKSLQERVKNLGGKWDRQRKVWLIRYGSITETTLKKLIIL